MALPADLNLGTAPDNGTGDPLREGGQKIKANFNYLEANKQDIGEKGQADGYAPLDENTLIPEQYIPFDSVLAALEANDIGDPAKSNEVDIFVIYGQSNAAGGTDITSGDPVQVPTDYGFKWDYADNAGGGLQQLADPTRKDGQQNISAWPAFGLRWARLTGRPAVIVNMAVGGRTVEQLMPSSEGGESTHFSDMIQATNDAIPALTSGGKIINSLQMYWCQGESDASDATDISTYFSSLNIIYDNFYNEFSSYTPKFYLSKIWGNTNNTNSNYWEEVERLGYAQVNATGSRSNWMCAFDKAPLFSVDNGLMGPDDSIHYSQKGYNWMGDESAINIYRDFKKYGSPKYEAILRNKNRDLKITQEQTTAHDSTQPDLPVIFKIKQQSLGSSLAKVENDKITLWDGEIINRDGLGFRLENGNRFIEDNIAGDTSIRFINGVFVSIHTNEGHSFSVYSDGGVRMKDLPSTNPGENKLWIDPSDNTVKIGDSIVTYLSETTLTETPRLYTAQQGFDEQSLTDASEISWNLNTQQTARLLATDAVGNTRTLPASILSNAEPGVNYQLTYVQDSSGSRELDLDEFDKVYGGIDLQADAESILTLLQTDTGTSFVIITSDVSQGIEGQTLTGTEINLSNVGGNNYNYATPEDAETYTTVSPVINGFARCFINAANEPTVTGATKVSGSLFQADTDMEMVIESPDGSAVEYYFIER